MQQIKKGLIDGIPIGLGYLSVAFTFGILASSYKIAWWQSLLISMTNLTSAGQFAGLQIMTEAGTLWEMAIVQLVINLRYALMSISLSQKADSDIHGIWRWILAAFHTDEIFAVAIGQKGKFTRKYFIGLTIAPYLGWATGTLLGALLGNVLPEMICSALGVALYGMFIAIFIPQMKKNKAVLITVIIALVLSSGFALVPVLREISVGFTVIICAVVASAIGAWLFPVKSTGKEA